MFLIFIYFLSTNFLHSAENNWFDIKERPPVAYVKLEILEGIDMKPADINGENNQRTAALAVTMFALLIL